MNNDAYTINSLNETIRTQQACIIALTVENQMLRRLVAPDAVALVDQITVLSAKLKQAEKQISDYSWKENPDRMGS